ncbi:glycine-rich protein [Williamsia sp. CHRR-6]|uniref:glycine-rich protein n=1 Tax=Williamsia sp. CHRR-6 TaxID=2835871 RepID=UPI001BDA114C|nr:glycine-rich protein [Williamsia sp. CHRR-6]MBT0565645.1 hypothetical protein [Williamsia sp. CHRR-6]
MSRASRRATALGTIVMAAAATFLATPTASAAPLPRNCTQALFQKSIRCVYTFTGTPQRFVVPAGLRSLLVTAVGAGGARPPGAKVEPTRANLISAYIPARAGQTLWVFVGGAGQPGRPGRGGYNGGATGYPSGGGGSSDVRTNPVDPRSTASLATRLIVAAGAGGTAITRGGDGGRGADNNFVRSGGGPAGFVRGGTADGDAQQGFFGAGGAGSPTTGGGGGGGGFFGGAGGYLGGGGGGGSNLPTTIPPKITSKGASVTFIFDGRCNIICLG